jgi:hypothetical protein
MSYIIALNLTLIVGWYILYIAKKKKSFKKTTYSQSSIHKIIKNFMNSDIYDKPTKPSQAEQYAEKNSVKVVFVDNEAYWVSNNIFYSASAENGRINTETAQPINTENMDKKDIDKLLIILDKLKDGSNNDSGGSGNKRI